MAAREVGLHTHILVLSPTPEVNCLVQLVKECGLLDISIGKFELSRESSPQQTNWSQDGGVSRSN